MTNNFDKWVDKNIRSACLDRRDIHNVLSVFVREIHSRFMAHDDDPEYYIANALEEVVRDFGLDGDK
jgi:hypothetical protein